VTLVVLAVAAALLATGLAHLLLISTPSPQSYFGWIVGLLTVAAVVAPFVSTGTLPVKLAQAVIPPRDRIGDRWAGQQTQPRRPVGR